MQQEWFFTWDLDDVQDLWFSLQAESRSSSSSNKSSGAYLLHKEWKIKRSLSEYFTPSTGPNGHFSCVRCTWAAHELFSEWEDESKLPRIEFHIRQSVVLRIFQWFKPILKKNGERKPHRQSSRIQIVLIIRYIEFSFMGSVLNSVSSRFFEGCAEAQQRGSYHCFRYWGQVFNLNAGKGKRKNVKSDGTMPWNVEPRNDGMQNRVICWRGSRFGISEWRGRIWGRTWAEGNRGTWWAKGQPQGREGREYCSEILAESAKKETKRKRCHSSYFFA